MQLGVLNLNEVVSDMYFPFPQTCNNMEIGFDTGKFDCLNNLPVPPSPIRSI